MRRRVGFWIVVGLLACAPLARAEGEPEGEDTPEEGETRRVTVRITALAGLEGYVDAGVEAGLAPGDRVLFTPPGGGRVEARIVAVTRASARVRFEVADATDLSGVDLGTEGDVRVPKERLEPRAQAGREAQGDAPPIPEHPPWEHPAVEWEGDAPLLAPIVGLTPAERARELHGRLFGSLDWTNDQGAGDRRYTALRGGLDATLENPFKDGGALDLEFDYSRRTSSFSDEPDETETFTRLERLAYRHGGVRGEPLFFEVGRFLHAEFPELGVIDGVELVQRTSGGSRFGASLGYLPEPNDDFRSGKDLAVSVFGRWVDGEEEHLRLGAAAQKTWHEGKADRDLLFSSLDWTPAPAFSLHGAAWVDLYGSNDRVKDGAELTQLELSGTWNVRPGAGLSLFASRIRWPELLRNEFDSLPDAELADFEVTRVGVRGWIPLGKKTRLGARIDRWSDEEASGGGGEVSVSTRDLLWKRGTFSAAVHTRTGRFTDTTGARFAATRAFRSGVFALSLNSALYQADDLVGGASDRLQHALQATWDWTLAEEWDLSLYAEERFGEDQDAQSVGLRLQWRF